MILLYLIVTIAYLLAAWMEWRRIATVTHPFTGAGGGFELAAALRDRRARYPDLPRGGHAEWP